MPDLFQYYGTDWLGMVFTFANLYLLGDKKKIGFVFGFFASICWLAFTIMANSIPGAFANAVFAFLNIRAYIKWGKKAV